MSDPRIESAVELMSRFAEETGLTSGRPPRRYLWTDAFATCNFLGLHRTTGERRWADLALQLVDRVHHTLGRHRSDDPRKGWISGLDPHEAEAHPTRGGLRIGKPLPERGPGEPRNERLEWDRDGQYFHYLTKWMHALDQVARATGRATYNDQARELADVAHRAFTYEPRTGPPGRMYWKMSIDLSRPLVASMGHHDPLDGFVTCVQLEATAARLGSQGTGPGLVRATSDFAAMIEPRGLATDDPLGLGGLLVDAYRLDQLLPHGALPGHVDLLDALLAAALFGLRTYLKSSEPGAPAARRLAFREIGLAIGLAAVDRMVHAERSENLSHRSSDTQAVLSQLARHVPVRTEIESFWLRPEHRSAAAWVDHQDINDVMLATSVVPEGFLVVES